MSGFPHARDHCQKHPQQEERDAWFLDDYTLNPYEGCSFNCQYCYIRGRKYGENMEGTLAVKINGPEVLHRQLAFRVKKDQRGIIALASSTDPYIKAEEKYRMTEQFLKLILLPSEILYRNVE